MSQIDGRLVSDCRTATQTAREFQEWVKRNDGQVRQERAALEKEFRRFGAEAGRLERAVERPMCVGVFGPSQSGKSYLISALARKGTSPLMARLGGRDIDFVREINPEGDRESTGLVTRFTIRPSSNATPEPVEMRLLTQMDIVKILGNTYYSDVDHNELDPPSPADITEVIEAVRPLAAATPIDALTPDDIFDLQAYFERSFKGNNRIRALRHSFWEEAAALAPRLGVTHRARLLSLIWGGTSQFTALYTRLYGDLARLGFPADAFAGMEALVPRESSIIDVESLKGLGSDQSDTLRIVGSNGTAVVLPRCEVTALIAELRIQIAEKPWDFFEHTDLLDFPGARSRELIKNLDQFLDQPEALQTLFLRGKVAYLFERYCAEQELTSMLLCIGPSNQEVKSLPEMVYHWIGATHGTSPEQRARQKTALYLVLTKFDMQFEEKAGEDPNHGGRWSARIGSSLTNYFGKQYDWPHNWDGTGPFRNVFWLRNPNFKARALFDFGDDGLEKAVRADASRRITAFRDGFLGNDDANRYFQDPSRAWEEAFKLNDGGVSYLAESLTPLCDPDLKRRQIRGRIGQLCQQMVERMAPYHVSADPNVNIEKRRIAAKKVASKLVQTAKAQRFGHLLTALQISEDDIQSIYYRVNTAVPEQGEDAQPAFGDAPDDDEMFADLGLEDYATAGAEQQRPKDDAQRFAEFVVAEWMRDLHDLVGNETSCAYFKLEGGAMNDLVQELISGAKRLDIESQIGQAVRRGTAFHMRFRESVAPTVRLTANHINGFVDFLGYDKMEIGRRPCITPRDGQPRPIFLPRTAPADYPRLDEKPSKYDQQYYTDWIKGFMETTELNAGFVDGQTIDLQANAQLSQFLSQLAAVSS